MLRFALTTTFLTTCALPAFADGHAGTAGYALADNGSNLITMADIAAPTDVNTVALSTAVRAIAWRPVTGELLGFADGAMYVIEPSSGVMTDLGATFLDDAVIPAGASVALDFNNAIDAVRAVSTAGDNLVYFPNGFGDGDEKAGSVRRFTDLAYAEGDAMVGTTPMIFANAYTNAITGKTAQTTFQYALDAETDTLVSLANNEGTLETVGKIMVNGALADISAMGGFDIVSAAEGVDAAYAVMQMEGEENSGLYAIDLSNGAASLLASFSVGGITGFAAAGN